MSQSQPELVLKFEAELVVTYSPLGSPVESIKVPDRVNVQRVQLPVLTRTALRGKERLGPEDR